MTKKSRTKDESFMLILYDLASKTDDMQTSFDRYEVGQLAGMQKTAVDTICKQLLRTNFIRFEEESLVSLTDNGIKLVERLHDE